MSKLFARTIAALPLAALALSACTVGPNYRPPALATPPAFVEAGAAQTPQGPLADGDLTQWWTRFGDPTLDDLIAKALADNPDLQIAASRVREARQQVRVAAAAELPSVNATGAGIAYNSDRKGESSSGSGASGGIQIPSHLSLYSVGFDATWELDLFGGTRRSIEAAKADTEAAEWARRDGQVSLVAEVANDYLTLRALQTRIALGQAELARQKSLFSLIQARRQAGFVTNLDVNQQTTQVAAAAAQIPQLAAQARGQIHALGVLVGQPPEALIDQLQPPPSDADQGQIASLLPPEPPPLPVGLPSDLLRRRPDIREAERRLAAANATIGVRQAALYPKINLIGLGTFAGTSVTELFNNSNLSSLGVGMLTQPLFDAGRNEAQIRAAKEEHFQAQVTYRETVLSGFRDVEDALARYRAETARRAALAQSLEAARNTIGIAQDQYGAGLVTFVNVLQAENAVLNTQDQLTQSDAQALSDLVSLYKALGGGWSATDTAATTLSP
jgi:NodT family efflux transporter outer membrane factor (OMF) lipoprotein